MGKNQANWSEQDCAAALTMMVMWGQFEIAIVQPGRLSSAWSQSEKFSHSLFLSVLWQWPPPKRENREQGGFQTQLLEFYLHHKHHC